MENFNAHKYSHLEEIPLSIYDSEIVYYGGDQNWFLKKIHQLSGCGPVAAANITAYLAQAFPEKYHNLYPYGGNINKNDFVEHMIEVRKYVKPGMMGLTSVEKFTNYVLAFANSKNITLTPHVLDEKATKMQDAIDFISEALSQKLPVAILVLTHPVKELEDYTWHWMTITRLWMDPKDSKHYIKVSSYGECHDIDLDLLWNKRRPQDEIRLAYFT